MFSTIRSTQTLVEFFVHTCMCFIINCIPRLFLTPCIHQYFHFYLLLLQGNDIAIFFYWLKVIVLNDLIQISTWRKLRDSWTAGVFPLYEWEIKKQESFSLLMCTKIIIPSFELFKKIGNHPSSPLHRKKKKIPK